MAQLVGGIKFTGTLDNLSAYTMRGSDKVILRRKGGPKKAQIKKSPRFESLRKNNNEWAGCTLAAKNFRTAISRIRHLADYNISGPLNGITKTAQKFDIENIKGERAIYISKFKELYEGFNLNQKNIFDGEVRVPIYPNINRENKTATIRIPSILPNIQLENAYKHPMCRFIVSFGIVSDVMYNENLKQFRAVNENRAYCNTFKQSEWRNTKQQIDACEISLALDEDIELNDYDSLILGIGIEFGNPLNENLVEPIKYSGRGKVMMIR